MATFDDVHALRAQLKDVEDAIAAARGGSAYSLAGRSITRQSLPDLQIERSRLRRELKQTQAYLEGVRDPSASIATWDANSWPR